MISTQVVGAKDGSLVLYENVGPTSVPDFGPRGGFISPVATVESSGNGAPAFSDVDGDGDEDLILGSTDGGLVLYENVGDAGKPLFERKDLLDGLTVGEDSTPALVDVGDGALGLVVGNSDGTLAYYRNVGSTGFERVEGADDPFAGIDVGENSAPHFADLDDDGLPDLVVGAYDGRLSYFRNAGSLGAPAFVNTTANPFANVSVGYYSAPALADVDGDDDLDLFVGERGGALIYYENTGSAAAPRFVKREGSENWLDGIDVGDDSKPAFVDLDGDGDLDFVAGEGDGGLVYYANGHCISSPKSCNGRGICDDSVVLLPLCNCLTGIAGAQCDRCQTGYYGSACDLCPEGGNETNSVPRITDTCGVAGSGRSRGTCDDGVAGSGNCTCFPHFAGESCTEGVCPAGTVENARKKGVFYEAFCEPCERGEYQVDDQCVKCPFPSTTTAVGATGCYACGVGSYYSPFPVGAVRCDDPATLEAQCREDAATCFDKCCLPCERGMDCGNPMNNTLRRVEVEDGWWRESEFSDHLYRCENSASCKGGLCTEGHKGVTCRVCEAGYHYSSMGRQCLKCGSVHKSNCRGAVDFCAQVRVLPGSSLRHRGRRVPRAPHRRLVYRLQAAAARAFRQGAWRGRGEAPHGHGRRGAQGDRPRDRRQGHREAAGRGERRGRGHGRPGRRRGGRHGRRRVDQGAGRGQRDGRRRRDGPPNEKG